MSSTTPTTEQFGAYQSAFDYFNTALFEGILPSCMLVFNARGRSLGYFASDRWGKDEGTAHEISLNPKSLASRTLEDNLSTLVHEMCHLWQHVFGNPSPGRYHNLEWADKMELVGLKPSHSGQPGGKRTGSRMTHYIETGGRFQRAFDAMPESAKLPWLSFHQSESQPPKDKNKIKYTCPRCKSNIWGKPGLSVVCFDCLSPEAISFVAQCKDLPALLMPLEVKQLGDNAHVYVAATIELDHEVESGEPEAIEPEPKRSIEATQKRSKRSTGAKEAIA